jgi:hypothetical protein
MFIAIVNGKNVGFLACGYTGCGKTHTFLESIYDFFKKKYLYLKFERVWMKILAL